MHPSASLRENAPIKFPQSGENGVVWPPLLLQHIVYNSDAVDLQVATARTRSCGRRLKTNCKDDQCRQNRAHSAPTAKNNKKSLKFNRGANSHV
ncbi:hypothetical protein AVEN_221786-1 [Araneus ventricosus]|uniref:Uncharacterized protein n=1 Tax=Araneus ventricosus TaxID=182803 RepID=A0A4Y2R0W2_ARAVE|nr:hypothetical protein AVEN_221786-1 [Araneus ventricosus]